MYAPDDLYPHEKIKMRWKLRLTIFQKSDTEDTSYRTVLVSPVASEAGTTPAGPLIQASEAPNLDKIVHIGLCTLCEVPVCIVPLTHVIPRLAAQPAAASNLQTINFHFLQRQDPVIGVQVFTWHYKPFNY